MKDVRIFGIPIHVEAEIDSLEALSAHADSEELLDWMAPLAPQLKRVFLVHGEPAQSQAMADAIRKRFGIEAKPAAPGETFPMTS
jgi:metallo-beta-lactamase family protein